MLKTGGIKKILSSHQLGRRNLSPIQRIAVAEKYRPIYEKQAKENQGVRNDLKNNIPQNIGESEKKKRAKDREVNSKLAKVANVNPETYRQAKRVLDSNNEELKERVLSGEIGGSAKKVGKRIKELERLYGIREGSAGGNGSNQYIKKELEPNSSVEAKKSQSDLATQMDISVQTLQNYKLLADMIPELSDLVDTGIVTKTTTLAIISLFDNNRNS